MTLQADAVLDRPALERLYRGLRRIRRVEEEIARIYPSDKIKSPVHLSIGQEAVAVGVCAALRADDVVAPTYRGHAAYLAKGGDLGAMMAELYGKATGSPWTISSWARRPWSGPPYRLPWVMRWH
jgi:TPP-dependent pyruvate/acetoin dehydrogenase alpha subunit